MANSTTQKLDRLAMQCWMDSRKTGVGYNFFINRAAVDHFGWIQLQWAADQMMLRCVRLEFDIKDELRPYQQDMVDAMALAFKATGETPSVFKLPRTAGKSIFMQTCDRAVRLPAPKEILSDIRFCSQWVAKP